MEEEPHIERMLLQDFDVVASRFTRSDEDKAELAFYLASTNIERYDRWGDVPNLEAAVTQARWAVARTATEDARLPSRLSRLGVALVYRHERTGNMDDLEEAIKVARLAVEATSDGDPDLMAWLNNLGSKLERRYKRTGSLEDLEEAIQIARRVVGATPEDNSKSLVARLHNLASKLERRYARTGNIDDLEGSIKMARQAVQDIYKDLPNLGGRLHELGNKLERRFERTGRTEDLEEAIELARKAVEATPKDLPDIAARLGGLGNKLGHRYRRSERLEDLEEAIEVARRAVEATPNDHPLLARRLTNLGNKLSSRYDRTGDIEDLEKATEAAQQAVKITPVDDPDSISWLNNLSNRLTRRYKHSGSMDDLDEAIKIARQVVQATPDDHPNLAEWLNNFAAKLRQSNLPNMSEVLQLYQAAWKCAAAPPFTRIRAALLAVVELSNAKEYEEAYQLSCDALEILPRVHDRSLSRDDQQYAVSNFCGLAPHASALALQIGKTPQEALEVLEQGRAAISGLLIDDRSDTTLLQKADPDLYITYENLRTEVNRPSNNMTDQRLQGAVRPRLEAINELEDCKQQIRRLPGFERFQLGLSPEQMQECAADGCIVVVNIQRLRSDAIIVTQKAIRSLALPDLDATQTRAWLAMELTTPAEGNEPSKNPQYRKYLSWLWKTGVKPILSDLGYWQAEKTDLPRIWWIGAGYASSMPFHAAGDIKRLAECTYSRVISSYTPSIKALFFAKTGNSGIADARCTAPKMLIATMASTPGARDLPGADAEQSAIVKVLGASASVQVLEQPTVLDVTQHLQSCSIAHFACHGVSDPENPSKSGLMLQPSGSLGEGAATDVLSVGMVSETHLPKAEIAYLSACSTAENRSWVLEEEVLHVVSGFQVAGFRHVVGCLWPSFDMVCVDVAKAFYADLNHDGHMVRDDRDVALALHKAVAAIREHEDYRKRPLTWAQYVHFGA